MAKETFTNGEVYRAGVALKELGNQKIPVMVSYKLAKVGKKLNEPLEVIEEVRQSLIKKYGTKGIRGDEVPLVIEQKDEAGKVTGIEPNPQWQLFQDEWAELMKQEISLEVDGKVKLPEKVAATCDKCHHNMDKMMEIEPRILIDLDRFVEV